MSQERVERALTRRQMMAAAGAVAGATLVGRCPMSFASTAQGAAAADVRWRHGGGLAQRGVDIAAGGREREGRFGLIFKKLPAYAPPDEALSKLARGMADLPPAPPGDPLDNPESPAGFTFFGQFVDHDMTFDQTPLGAQRVDPYALTNFDTPRFDLASVYGEGPQGSPELYEDGRPERLRLVRPHDILDLPRRDD